jgi:hypothetical protein
MYTVQFGDYIYGTPKVHAVSCLCGSRIDILSL